MFDLSTGIELLLIALLVALITRRTRRPYTIALVIWGLLLAARALIVYGLGALAAWQRRSLPWSWRHVIVWGGLGRLPRCADQGPRMACRSLAEHRLALPPDEDTFTCKHTKRSSPRRSAVV